MLIALAHSDGSVRFINTGYLVHAHYEPADHKHPVQLSAWMDIEDIEGRRQAQELSFTGPDAEGLMAALVSRSETTVNLDRVPVGGHGKAG